MIHGLQRKPYRSFVPEVGQINWSHPLAQGLWFAASFGQNTLFVRDMVTGRRCSTFGTVSMSTLPYGRALTTAGGGDHRVFETGRLPVLPVTTVGISSFVIARGPTGNGRKRALRVGNATNGTIHSLDFGNGSATRRLNTSIQKTGGTFDEQLILASYVANQDYKVGMTLRPGGEQRGYLDGRLVVTGSPITPIANADDIYIGGHAGSLSLGGSVYLAYVWGRNIGNELQSWVANSPYDFFRPYGRAQWLVPQLPATGPQTYTRSETDRIFFREDQYRKALLHRDEQVLLGETTTRKILYVRADDILLADTTLIQAIRGVLETDRVLVADDQTRKVELTRQDQTLISDEFTRKVELVATDRILLTDSAAAALIKAILAVDSVMFSEATLREALLTRLDEVLTVDEVARIVMLSRVDHVLLADTVSSTVIKAILAIDGILLDDRTVREMLIAHRDGLLVSDEAFRQFLATRLDAVLLSDSATVDWIRALLEVFHVDSLLLRDDTSLGVSMVRGDTVLFLDRVVREALLTVRDSVLLSDSAAVSVVRGILMSDGLVIFDEAFTRQLHSVFAQDRILLDSIARRVVELMHYDNLLLSDAVSAILTSAEVALIFARVDVADLLGRTTRTRDLLTREVGTQDYLGRTVGTKRQIRGDIH